MNDNVGTLGKQNVSMSAMNVFWVRIEHHVILLNNLTFHYLR